MMYRKFVMAAVCVITAVMASPASAAVVFSEDFQSYGDGASITSGTNPNGWSLSATPITTANTNAFDGSTYTFTPSAAQTIFASAPLDDRNTFPNVDTSFVDRNVPEASGAPLSLVNTGIATLSYDFAMASAGSSTSSGPSGILLRDTSTGKNLLVYSASSLFWINVGDAAGIDSAVLDFFADSVPALNLDRQNMTLTMNFDTGIAFATVSSATVTYNPGGLSTFVGPNVVMPAGFAPDEIVIFNGGPGLVGNFFNRGPKFDNIVVEGTAIPEPTSLALVAMGGLLIALRRKR